MDFDSVPVSSAEGGILAHSLRVGVAMFRKGRVLSASDIAELEKAGYQEVTIARLAAADVSENLAAERIARAIAGRGVTVGASFTGRANLYTKSAGLLRIAGDAIAKVNAIDEAITVATLAPFEHVGPRQMIATVKIIPFAAPVAAVEKAEGLFADGPAIEVAPFSAKRVALISTMTAGMKVSLLDKNRSALDARVAPLGSSIVFEERVAHRIDDLATAIRAAHAAGDNPILVFGASAITDRRDVVPAAIVAAGGAIDHFGMPVDPGNLLLLGHIRETIVVGLPGCARSPKLNGFDFVLQRLLADIPVARADIAAMGVGGLLKEIPSRPQPRETGTELSVARAPRIAAIILAAGLSSRMGRNKLAAEVRGQPLLRHAADAALASSASPVIAVTGSDADIVEGALSGLPIQVVRNPDFRTGLSASLIAGINALSKDCDGAVILLGDMPNVSAQLIDKLIAAFDPAEDRAICVATHHHKRGNPVLWSSAFFPEMRALRGDVGAKSLLAAHADLVCEVEAPDDGPLFDIDTPETLAAYAGRSS
jgi:molybdenum cofactor cytidylyltransferase